MRHRHPASSPASRPVRRRALRPLLRPALLALCLGAVGTPGLAQEAGAPRSLSIRAQPLAEALNDWARQTGIQLIAPQDLVAGRRAPAVAGELTPMAALQRLLAGSGLEAHREAGAVVIRATPAGAAGPATGAVGSTAALPPVNVTADRETALGRVSGYAARRSSTAMKMDVPLVETAQTVNVVTADEIEARDAQTMTEAFGYTSSINSMGGGNNQTGDTMVIRGFNVGSLPVYMNGARLPRNTFTGTAEPYSLERLELLKGPASVLYGAAAPGGLINMVSKLPQTTAQRELRLQLGSFERKQIAGDITGPIDAEGKFSYRLTGLLRKSDTSVDYIPDDRDFIQGALTWRPQAQTSLTLIANRQHSRSMYNYGLPVNGTTRFNPNGEIPRDRFVGESDFNRFDSTNYSLGYLFSHAFNESLSFRQNLLFYSADYVYNDVANSTLDATQRLLSRSTYLRSNSNKTLSIDNQLEFKWQTGAAEHTTLVGLDYTRTTFTWLQRNGTVAPLDLFAPVYGAPITMNAQRSSDYVDRSDLTGLYAQHHLKWDKVWVLSLGLRHDRAGSDTQNWLTSRRVDNYDTQANTGRVGLVRLFDNGLAPYLSYATSFQPISGATVTGEAFKPTEGRQIEAGVRYQPPASRMMLTASVYDLTQTNVTTTDTANPGYSIQVGEVRSRGVELEAKTHLGGGLSVIASYGYLNNEVTRSNSGTVGQRYGGVPRHKASLWVDQQMDKVNVGAGVRFNSETLNLANTYNVPAYTVVDAALNYRPLPEWLLSLNISNLLDRRYATCTYACFYGQPRRLTATLSYRF